MRHDRGVHAAIERPLRETAIRTGNHILASDKSGQPDDAFGDQFGMLDHVGRVADDARNEDLSGPKLCVLPQLPLVLMVFGLIGAACTVASFTQIDLTTNLWWIRGLMFTRGIFMYWSMTLAGVRPRSATSLWRRRMKRTSGSVST